MGNAAFAAATPATYGFGWQALRLRLDFADDAALLSVADQAEGCGLRAHRVSALLGLAYDLPDQPFEPERLSMIDRTAALFHLAFRFGTWPARFVCRCAGCGAGNALRVAPEEFRYSPAKSYLVDHAGGRLMQPNGHHEGAMEQGADLAPGDLVATGAPDPAGALQALADAGPAFAAALPYRCSKCAAENWFWFDPLQWIGDHLRGLMMQMHRLARAYGWTEPQILALPRARRQAYLRLIEAEDGA